MCLARRCRAPGWLRIKNVTEANSISATPIAVPLAVLVGRMPASVTNIVEPPRTVSRPAHVSRGCRRVQCMDLLGASAVPAAVRELPTQNRTARRCIEPRDDARCALAPHDMHTGLSRRYPVSGE